MMDPNDSESAARLPEFSLIDGGPLFQFEQRLQISSDEIWRTTTRVLVVTLLTWLPLCILAAFEGHLFRTSTAIPFVLDIGTQARFLVALPILLIADLTINRRLGPRIHSFANRGIISGVSKEKFFAAIDAAHRVRNSKWVEIGLGILVYTVGIWSWRRQMAFAAPSWFANPDGTNLNLTLAGYWFAIVSVPVFQFLLLRWYARFLIWFWFLWRVSRLKLKLIPTHPDRAAGIGFLGKATYAFGVILFAQGVLLAGLIGNLVLHDGRNLMEFRVLAAGYIGFFVVLAVVPLLVFVPNLLKEKREGLGVYGAFATRYVDGFEHKWIEGVNPDGEPLLGSTDIQSLADLGNSYSMIRAMRLAPFAPADMLLLAACTAAPLLPLTLFVFSLDELLDKLLKVIL